MLLGFVLGGSVAVEQAFGVPGLGRSLVTAIIERDIIVVQNLVLLYALIFVVVNVAGRPLLRVARSAHPVPERGPPRCSPLRRAGTRCRRSAGSSGCSSSSIALAAPLIAPRDPLKTDFRRMNKPPDAQSLFGTDQVGRDTLSRVIYGARTSLFVAFAAVLLGTTVGSLWGVACGYLGGRFDLGASG